MLKLYDSPYSNGVYRPGKSDPALWSPPVPTRLPGRVSLPPSAPARPIPDDAPVVAPSRGWRARNWLRKLVNGSHVIPAVAGLARRVGLLVGYAELRLRKFDGASGAVIDYGVVSRRLVTTAGVAFLAGCFDNTNEAESMNYHGFGTGTTAENASDTALVTEFTTQYAVDNTRPTGTQSKSTNTYTTSADFAPDSGGTLAVTEHGLFNQAATGGGTLFDRSVFSAVNVVAGSDTLSADWTGTFPSGG